MTDRVGYGSAADQGDDFAQLNFLVQQLTGQMATATLVKVLAVNNTGGVSPVGLLDCQPIVHQMDGEGKAVDHVTMHNVPYFRLQGGANAVIMDPAVGDIGLAVFASHDISRVKNTRAAALPGSRRRFDWADGLYIGGFLNGTPTNFIRFDSAGDIHLQPASKVYIQGDVDVSGDVVASGISLTHHQHGNVQNGGGETGEPIA